MKHGGHTVTEVTTYPEREKTLGVFGFPFYNMQLFMGICMQPRRQDPLETLLHLANKKNSLSKYAQTFGL